ncbi:TPA: hypothetical protein N3I75_003681 [Salmonella enterica subsp. enterica serovar Java]|nr:hypothetical protein [Salmonella enterica subsp. enterica serovar Java]
MKIERFFYAGKFTIGFGISSELWHIERKNGGKAISFFHLGYTPDLNPQQKFKASLIMLTVLWFTIRLGVIDWERMT